MRHKTADLRDSQCIISDTDTIGVLRCLVLEDRIDKND